MANIYTDKLSIISEYHSIAEVAREVGLPSRFISAIARGSYTPTGDVLKKFNNLYNRSSYQFARDAGAPVHIATSLRGASVSRLKDSVTKITEAINFYTDSAIEAYKIRAKSTGEKFNLSAITKTLTEAVFNGVSTSKEDWTTLFLDRYPHRGITG